MRLRVPNVDLVIPKFMGLYDRFASHTVSPVVLSV